MKKGQKNVAFVIELVLVACFAAWGVERLVDTRPVGPPRAADGPVHRQLLSLRQHLRAYRDKHGRYPDNSEGLAVLDTFDAQFDVVLTLHPCQDPYPLDLDGDGHMDNDWFGRESQIQDGRNDATPE